MPGKVTFSGVNPELSTSEYVAFLVESLGYVPTDYFDMPMEHPLPEEKERLGVLDPHQTRFYFPWKRQRMVIGHLSPSNDDSSKWTCSVSGVSNLGAMTIICLHLSEALDIDIKISIGNGGQWERMTEPDI